jgi:hypothetical protein
MDANAPRRGGPRLPTGGLAVAVTVVGLVAIVAIASSGSLPSGEIAQRRPSDGLLDTLISLFLVLMVLGAVVSVLMLPLFGRYAPEASAPKRRSWLHSLVTLVVVIVLILLFAHASTNGNRTPTVPSDQTGAGEATDGLSRGRYEPEFAVWPVLGVTALALVALGAWWLSVRGRRSEAESPELTPEEALADVLAATLDDLRAEVDPRRAVIGAYARMERSLAAVGMPRASAEAPEEYLARVLEGLPVSARAAGRLTGLFAWARFSPHDVRPEMKDEAIETLEQLQQELAAAEAEREARLAGMLA